MRPTGFDRAGLMRRCMEMAMAGIHREFPHQFPLVLDGPTLFQRPRELTPAFYGCYDWHSAVHSHWLLVRWLSLNSCDLPGGADVRSSLSENLTAEKLAAEYRFLNYPLRTSFERPYGLAWLLQLAAELREWQDPLAVAWQSALQPLEHLASSRFCEWLPKLHSPVRTGEHNQTAFALGLVFDWAILAADQMVADLIRTTANRFYSADCDLPLAWEPSGHDFLSASLATADLMRRVMDPDVFSNWLSTALPRFPGEPKLEPIPPPYDLRDGKLAHFVGLNFSRAWMLNGIARGLPQGDRRRPGLVRLAWEHLLSGVPLLKCNEYAVTHWVGSFAMYALSELAGDVAPAHICG